MRSQVGPSLVALGLAEGRSLAPKNGKRPAALRQRQAKPAADEAVRYGARAGHRRLSSTYAKFSVDDQTRQVRIKIIDAASGEIVREIPPWDSGKASAAFSLALAGMGSQPEEALRAHASISAEVVQRLILD